MQPDTGPSLQRGAPMYASDGHLINNSPDVESPAPPQLAHRARSSTSRDTNKMSGSEVVCWIAILITVVVLIPLYTMKKKPTAPNAGVEAIPLTSCPERDLRIGAPVGVCKPQCFVNVPGANVGGGEAIEVMCSNAWCDSDKTGCTCELRPEYALCDGKMLFAFPGNPYFDRVMNGTWFRHTGPSPPLELIDLYRNLTRLVT